LESDQPKNQNFDWLCFGLILGQNKANQILGFGWFKIAKSSYVTLSFWYIYLHDLFSDFYLLLFDLYANVLKSTS